MTDSVDSLARLRVENAQLSRENERLRDVRAENFLLRDVLTHMLECNPSSRQYCAQCERWAREILKGGAEND